MPGNGPEYLTTGSAVVVTPTGEIYVADGHGAGTNDRIVKFSKDGKFIAAWGKHGKAAGEFDTPHEDGDSSAGNAANDRCKRRHSHRINRFLVCSVEGHRDGVSWKVPAHLVVQIDNVREEGGR